MDDANAGTDADLPLRPKPARIRRPGEPLSQQEQDLHDRLVWQRDRMRASRCPNCGNEPVEARARWQQRQDLAITWLYPDTTKPDAVTETRHCAECQPHQHFQLIVCPLCGDGPMIAGELADAAADEHTPAPPVREWLTDHGWQHDPDHGLICAEHQRNRT